MKSQKTQLFHRKNCNSNSLKIQNNHKDAQNVSLISYKKVFHRKPQKKIDPFSELESNRLQAITNNQTLSKLNESAVSNPTNLIRNSKSVKFLRKGNKNCLDQNFQQNSKILEQSYQNFGGKSLIINRLSPNKLMDSSYLEEVLSLKSVQQFKGNKTTYISKKKSFQNILDESCHNSAYLDFIQENQSINQKKNHQILKQENQNLKNRNQKLQGQVCELKNQIFKLKKRVNFLQNKNSMPQTSNQENNLKNNKKYEQLFVVKIQSLQKVNQSLKRSNYQLQEKFQVLQNNLEKKIYEKQTKINELQQITSNLYQIIHLKETSQKKLHDFLQSYKKKLDELSQELKYKSIQNNVLLKIKKDYVSLCFQLGKIKDQRNYFRNKLQQYKKLNKDIIQQSINRSPFKHKSLEKQKRKRSNSNGQQINRATCSTSQTDFQYFRQSQLKIYKKQQSFSKNNLKKESSFKLDDIYKQDGFFELSQSQNQELLQ